MITVAEFEQLSPAEQDQVFEQSIVTDLSDVPPPFLTRVRERVATRTEAAGDGPPKA